MELEEKNLIPMNFEDTVIKGLPFNLLINQELDIIHKIIFDERTLFKITSDRLLSDIDMTVFSYDRGFFSGIAGRSKLIYEVTNSNDILMNPIVKETYFKLFLDLNVGIVHIHEDNFGYDISGHRLATKDFRVFVNDLTKKVPKQILISVGTHILYALSGHFDVMRCNDHIRELLKSYGNPVLFYHGMGYLHIDICNNKKESEKLLSIREGINPFPES